MQFGKFYKNKLSSLTYRYKGLFVGINIENDEVHVWAERVFKVYPDRSAYKTENLLDARYPFKKAEPWVSKLADSLEALLKTLPEPGGHEVDDTNQLQEPQNKDQDQEHLKNVVEGLSNVKSVDNPEQRHPDQNDDKDSNKDFHSTPLLKDSEEIQHPTQEDEGQGNVADSLGDRGVELGLAVNDVTSANDQKKE